MKEHDVIGRLRAAFETWGLGDDAAVLAPPGGDLLVASDAVVEGVHFNRGRATLAQVVQKVITSNVSDIYAMGGVPQSILLTAGLPEGFGEVDLDGIVAGIELACRAYGVRLVGGDTVRSPGGCFFDVAITGSVERGRAVPRSGARPGDAMVLFGECGGSLAGMMLLDLTPGEDAVAGRGGDAAAGGRAARGEGAGQINRDSEFTGAELFGELVSVDEATLAGIERIAPELWLSIAASEIEHLCAAYGLGREEAPLVRLVKQHLVPLARPLDPAMLSSGATPITAMIDVSDGLSKDLATLCVESGVGAVIDERAIPVPDLLARAAPAARRGALTRIALSSGEEYVLLAAIRGLGEGAALPTGTVVGRVVEQREGITLVTREGKRISWPDLGYEHAF